MTSQIITNRTEYDQNSTILVIAVVASFGCLLWIVKFHWKLKLELKMNLNSGPQISSKYPLMSSVQSNESRMWTLVLAPSSILIYRLFNDFSRDRVSNVCNTMIITCYELLFLYLIKSVLCLSCIRNHWVNLEIQKLIAYVVVFYVNFTIFVFREYFEF